MIELIFIFTVSVILLLIYIREIIVDPSRKLTPLSDLGVICVIFITSIFAIAVFIGILLSGGGM